MSEQYANCTVSHRMHSDRRFDMLAQLAGWSRPEACWRMVELWSRCTALQTDRPPSEEIRIHLGLRGEQLLVDAVLGERQSDGSIRVLGGGLTGGDTDRFGWFEPMREQNRDAGLKRARTAVRGPDGRFGAGTARSSDRPAPTSGSASAGPAASSGSPADTGAGPASGFRIPDPEDQTLPSARAIPPNPEPAPTGDAALRRRQQIRAAIWAELAAARAEVAAELGTTAAQAALLAQDPGEQALAMKLLGARSEAELEQIAEQARHAIAISAAEAREARSVEWLTGVMFDSDRVWRRLLGKRLEDIGRSARAGPRSNALPVRKLKTL